MASNITLSASVRQNLLSLQSTAELMSTTQNRLATGKKVNSALDNPSNFFTSQSLNNRASDLNSLLDSIGQAQQTLKAADQGITSLTKLVESAKSVARQARQAPQPGAAGYSAVTSTGTVQAETLGSFTASAYAAPGSAGTLAFTVTVNGTAYNLTTASIGTSATVTDVRDAINTAIAGNVNTAGHAAASLDGTSTYLKLDASDADTDITITASAVSAAIGLTTDASTNRSINSTSLLDNIVTAGGVAGTASLDVAVNGGANQNIVFGTGVGQISTLDELNTKLASLSGVTASASSTTVSFNVASSTSQNSLALGGAASVATALGVTFATTNGTAYASSPDSTRTSLQSDFNNILTQIDSLAKDASYNGVNLLNGDDLKVVFNETGTSSQTISGVTFDSAGLGLSSVSGTGFQSDTTIDAEIAKLDAALSNLRTQASKFGSNLTTVQTRQDFTKNMITTLQTGADNLVLADTNEEGANLLALQTRQQLSTTALSLSAQADQAVLRLF
jgi:flagellin-like hook-associated protein FlgL